MGYRRVVHRVHLGFLVGRVVVRHDAVRPNRRVSAGCPPHDSALGTAIVAVSSGEWDAGGRKRGGG